MKTLSAWQRYTFDAIPLKFEWPLIAGLSMLLLYVSQNIFNLSPSWLIELQQNNIYQQVTGFILLFYIVGQWKLAKLRITCQAGNSRLRAKHKYGGLFAPIIVYLHSVSLGYGYQELLIIAYLGNYFVGLFNPDVFRNKTQSYYAGWLLLHISLSLLVVAITYYHIYVVYAY